MTAEPFDFERDDDDSVWGSPYDPSDPGELLELRSGGWHLAGRPVPPGAVLDLVCDHQCTDPDCDVDSWWASVRFEGGDPDGVTVTLRFTGVSWRIPSERAEGASWRWPPALLEHGKGAP